MKVFLLLLFLITISLSAQETSEIPQTLKYQMHLIRFYLNEQEFENVINYADSAMQEHIMLDSLHYFKASALYEMENWEEAANHYGKSILYNDNEDFINNITNYYKEALSKMPSLKAIELNSEIIDNTKNNYQHNHFLMIMADLYEENNLFEEANDVYKTILNSSITKQPIRLEMKIARNYIYQKKYTDALHILDLVIASQNELYTADALFLYYLASYSNKEYKTAKNTLIELYCNYPLHSQREEILRSLSELLVKEEQYLMSLYFLKELNKISNESQRLKTYQEIIRIKKLFMRNSSINDQYKYLKPNFDNQPRIDEEQ